MDRISNACNINIEKKNYPKDRTVCKVVTIETEETIITPSSINNICASHQQPKSNKFNNHNVNNPKVSAYENRKPPSGCK